MMLAQACVKRKADRFKYFCAVPFWKAQALTSAAQALLPQAQQHALAHIAVNRLVEVFHPPKVLSV